MWDRGSGIGLDAAVASSCSVPGVFPPVGFGGHHYIDVPRRPFSGDLLKSKSLDAIVFVGLILPILANNNDQKIELENATGGRLRTVTVTGGPGVAEISGDLLDHSARVRAVQVGLEDGVSAERVQVKLGRNSVNTVEVLSGLKVGDQVILSDMSAYDAYDRIRLK